MASKEPEKFDIRSHLLVPEHTKLTQKEKQEILSASQFNLKDLPKILTNDPAIQHLDTKIGDVVRISRKSLTAGEAIIYRRVANE